MFDIALITKTLIILALAVVSPGPDFFMVLRNSLVYGRKAGLFSAFGIAAGCFISFSVLIGGLEFLFAYHPVKLLLSLACGSYLIYLGITSIRHKSHRNTLNFSQQKSEHSNKPMHIYFRNGLLTNILNPKLYTLAGAILAYTEQQHPTFATNSAIVIGNALIALIWFSCTCFLLSHPRIQTAYLKREMLINRLLGCLLIVIGFRVMLMLLE